MIHLEKIADLIMDVIEAYPRLCGLVLGISAHPIFAAIFR